MSPLDTLRTVFGFDEFRDLQQPIVDTLISGHDAFVLMPTGGGKSLCYQIPALHRDGVGIVVSPLISLMKDQVDALRVNGVNADYYNSSLSSSQAQQVLQRLHQRQTDLLGVGNYILRCGFCFVHIINSGHFGLGVRNNSFRLD